MRRDVLVVEQARFGEQQRARAGRRERRAGRVARAQPFGLFPVAAARVVARQHHEIGDRDDVGRGALGERSLRLDGEPVRRAEGPAVARDDERAEHRLAGLALGHDVPVAPGRFEDLDHAVERRGRRFGDGQHRDDELRVRVRNGRFVRLMPETTLAEPGGRH